MEKKIKFRRIMSAFLAFLMVIGGVSFGADSIPVVEASDGYLMPEPPSSTVLDWSEEGGWPTQITWNPADRWDGSGRPGKIYASNGDSGEARWIVDDRGNTFYCIEPGVLLGVGQTYSRQGIYNGYKAEEIKLAAAFLTNMVVQYNEDGDVVGWVQTTNPGFSSPRSLNMYIWATLGRAKPTSAQGQSLLNSLSDKIEQYKKGTYPNPEHFAGEATIYRYETSSRENQVLIGISLKEDNSPKLSLKKESTNPSYVKDNPNYSLAGAEYGIYASQSNAMNDKNRLGTFTSDSNGDTNTLKLQEGTYYVKETKAPKGYELDPKPYKIELSGEGQTFTVKDKPKTDPLSVMLKKTDNKGKGLADAEFEVKYYEELTSDVSGLTPKYTWKLKTDDQGFLQLRDQFKIGGDEIPKDENGRTAGYIGTYTIQETKAPSGYVLDDTLYIRQLKEEGGSSVLVFNAPTHENKLKKVSLSITKVEMGTIGKDQIPVAGARYRLVAVDEAKGETIVGEYVTDKDGRFEIKDLVRGKYYLVEIESPKGYLLDGKKYEFDLRDKDHEEVVKATIENERIPEIETNAKDNKTGEKEINPSKKVEIIDIVKYKGLIVGKEYELVGHLMDKATNKPILDKDGNMIKSSLKFTPETRDGEVSLVFELDGSLLRGKEIVVFETLYREGREVAIHHDINDEAQTVEITDPKGKTYAKWEDGSKEVYEGKVHKLIDTFIYKNLIPGREYKLIAYVVFKDNGKAMTERKEITFTPESKNGSIEVEFEIDTSKLGGKELVVFEELYDMEGNLLIDHKDINDKDQTVKVNKKPVENPKTGDFDLEVYASMLTIATMIFFTLKNRSKEKNI